MGRKRQPRIARGRSRPAAGPSAACGGQVGGCWCDCEVAGSRAHVHPALAPQTRTAYPLSNACFVPPPFFICSCFCGCQALGRHRCRWTTGGGCGSRPTSTPGAARRRTSSTPDQTWSGQTRPGHPTWRCACPRQLAAAPPGRHKADNPQHMHRLQLLPFRRTHTHTHTHAHTHTHTHTHTHNTHTHTHSISLLTPVSAQAPGRLPPQPGPRAGAPARRPPPRLRPHTHSRHRSHQSHPR